MNNEKKIHKGRVMPTESLMADTLKLVETECDTNDKIYIVRNILALVQNGLEYNIRNILRILKEHGENTRVIIKDEKMVYEYQKDFGIPASNIGYLFGPISKGIWKNNISLDEIHNFQLKSSALIQDLKETEDLGIKIVVNNNIDIKEIPAVSLRKKIEEKIVLYEQIKDKKQLDDLKIRKKREKNKKNKERLKLKREKRKQNINEFLEDTQLKEKTYEDLILFANENGIKLIEKSSNSQELLSELVNSAKKIVGIKQEEKEVDTLPMKDDKTIAQWIEYAEIKKIDLAGATLKDDIYDLIKLEHIK